MTMTTQVLLSYYTIEYPNEQEKEYREEKQHDALLSFF